MNKDIKMSSHNWITFQKWISAGDNKSRYNDMLDSTGLSQTDFDHLLETTGWKYDEALINLNSCIAGTVGSAYSQGAILEGLKSAGLYSDLAKSLSNLNTMRGGVKGFKGFVFEEMHATEASIKGQKISVINDNGIADFQIIGPKGKISHAQSKIGYESAAVDFSKYKGQTIVIDKGNKVLIKKAKSAGLKVVESDIPGVDAQRIADQMQLESKITGNPNSVIIPKMHSATNSMKQAHGVGVKTAKTSAHFGAGFSIATNMAEVISGDKDGPEAIVDIAVDTAVAGGVGYATGATATVIGNTAVGAAASSVISTATSAVAGTTVGGAVIGASSAAVGTIGGLGTAAVTSTIAGGTAVGTAVAAAGTTLGTAVAGTAVGGATVTAATAVGGAIAGTAVGGAAVAAGAAVGGAAVAASAAVVAGAVVAAPVVAVGLVAGAVFSGLKSLFGR